MENRDHLLNEALEYFNGGKYQQTINLIAASELRTTAAGSYYEIMGYCYYRLNQFENASWYLEKAVDYNPGYNLLQDCLASAYALSGQDEKALEKILYLNQTYPGNDLFTYHYGYFEYTHERFATALPLLQDAFSLNPDIHEDIYFYIGVCYYKLEENDAAIEYLKKHAEKKPDFPDTYYLLGCAYKRLDDNDTAINYLSQALWYKEDYDDALFNRFQIKKENGDYDGAEKDLIRLMQINPEYIQLRSSEGKPLRVTSVKINRLNGNIDFTVDMENESS